MPIDQAPFPTGSRAVAHLIGGLLGTVLLLTGCPSHEPDGLPPSGHWEKHPANPVLPKGSPYGSDFYSISDGWVIKVANRYQMWYTSGGAVSPDTLLHASISYATSADGIHWEKYAHNPVLDRSPTAWDSLGVETVSVLVDSTAPADRRYQLWYAGQSGPGSRYQIGYAYSADGMHWTKHPHPVLTTGTGGEWDNAFLEGPSVLKTEQTYQLWYASLDTLANGQDSDGKVSIGYATSLDGIHWQKHPANPVLTPSPGSWDAVYVQDPHVIQHGGGYHLWYGGADQYDAYSQQTGYAYSVDGIHWTMSPNNPVLKRGLPGHWDANTASFPSVMLDESQIKMWYTGKDVDPLPAWPQPYYWEIGYATKALPKGPMLD